MEVESEDSWGAASEEGDSDAVDSDWAESEVDELVASVDDDS